jgi:hypothetical protein
MAFVLHRKAVPVFVWNTATSTVLRKVIKEMQWCQKSRKLLDVSLAGK